MSFLFLYKVYITILAPPPPPSPFNNKWPNQVIHLALVYTNKGQSLTILIFHYCKYNLTVDFDVATSDHSPETTNRIVTRGRIYYPFFYLGRCRSWLTLMWQQCLAKCFSSNHSIFHLHRFEIRFLPFYIFGELKKTHSFALSVAVSAVYSRTKPSILHPTSTCHLSVNHSAFLPEDGAHVCPQKTITVEDARVAHPIHLFSITDIRGLWRLLIVTCRIIARWVKTNARVACSEICVNLLNVVLHLVTVTLSIWILILLMGREYKI